LDEMILKILAKFYAIAYVYKDKKKEEFAELKKFFNRNLLW